MASKQACNATIDRSNAKQLEGSPMISALQGLQDPPMRVNRQNVEAMKLLSEDEGLEAAALLRTALSEDPHNPFTMNNLGVASEAVGDFDSALKYYRAAAALRSSEPVMVTTNPAWRGKPVSAMAAESARQLEKRVEAMSSPEAQGALFTLQGVFAANQNDWTLARQDFVRAYSLNPFSAFTLNNRGYVAERDGDLETAKFFYGKARKALDTNRPVGLATRQSAEGRRVVTVAAESDTKVDERLSQYSRERKSQSGPIELIPRDDTSPKDSPSPDERIESPDSPLVEPGPSGPPTAH
jgi:Flp pilus assembly protein TadD